MLVQHLPDRILSTLALVMVTSLVPALPVSAQGVRWDGPEVEATGWVLTDAAFIGWIWCGENGTEDWIYPLALETYLYMPAEQVQDIGSWAYAIDTDPFDLMAEPSWPADWYRSEALGSWVYASADVVATGTGWTYIWNGGGALPLVPETIVLTASHWADHDAAQIEDKFADALHIGPDYLARFADIDPDIEMIRGPDDVTFTSTVLFPAGNQNRYVRLGFHEAEGYLDLTALENISGRIGIALHADVDLSQTSNGFYVRVKRGDADVAAYERLSAGVVEQDIFLEPYLTNFEDKAYVEITLPWQGSITIKDIYLYMDLEVRGFADMAGRITGGTGAGTENIHTVTNAAEFLTALNAVESAAAPSIIQVAGAVTFEDWQAAGESNREAQLGGNIRDLTIVGIGDQGLLDGVGLAIQGTNIIVQNLTVRHVLARDAIQVNNGQYILIDHCTLYNEPFDINPDKDKFDELISIKNNAQHVIVSWNEIFDTHKTILVGSNDGEDALPDRRVIFHHNWFHDGGSRHPLFRGGYAHIYNNYYQNIDSGINVRTNSKILIENNYFEDSGGAIGYWFDTSNPAGKFEVSGNIFDNVGGDKPTTSTIDIQFAGDYAYSLDPAEDVPSIVTAGAGAGKL